MSQNKVDIDFGDKENQTRFFSGSVQRLKTLAIILGMREEEQNKKNGISNVNEKTNKVVIEDDI